MTNLHDIPYNGQFKSKLIEPICHYHDFRTSEKAAIFCVVELDEFPKSTRISVHHSGSVTKGFKQRIYLRDRSRKIYFYFVADLFQ